MKRERPPVTRMLARCLRLRCPACGRSSIARGAFQIRHHCPSCGALFKREEGFFVGAVAINLVTTELLILVVYGACLPLVMTRYELVIAALLCLALLFPVAFYHHSWSAWLCLDHLVESLPRQGTQDSGE